MHRIIISGRGGPQRLISETAADPVPATGEVAVRVARAGVNFADVLQRMGLYPETPKPPFVPGYEIAGHVTAIGDEVDGLAVGEAVMALLDRGGYASHVALPASQLLRLPASVDLEAAAALPLNYLTAHLAVVHPGALQPGETVLIHGAAGGVGIAATQLARLRGAEAIYGTASPSKHAFLEEQRVVPIHHNDFRHAVRQATSGRGVDLVLDPVGGSHLRESYRCLASGGRLCAYGISAMVTCERRRLWTMLRTLWRMPRFKPLHMMGANRGVFGLNPGSYRDTDRLRRVLAELLDWLAAGKIAPRIDRVFSAAEAAAAHRYLQERRNIGKVLLDFEK